MPRSARMAEVSRSFNTLKGSAAPPAQVATFAPGEASNIYIRGVGLTDANNAAPVLGTFGVGPCVAVAVYNPQTRTGLLAHLDARTDPQSLNQLLDRLDGGGAALQAHVVGGQEQTRHLVEETLSVLESRPGLSIKTTDVLNDRGLRSLALDTRTGEVFDRFMPGDLTKHPRHSEIMGMHAATALTPAGLRMEYDFGFVPPVFPPRPVAPAP